MEFEDLKRIYNYKRLSDDIATAGQPTDRELMSVVLAGFDVIINLDVSNAECDIADEKEIVESLGLAYVHIPVDRDRPTSKDLDDFFQALTAFRGNKIFIHCAANKRASVFMALYRILNLGWPRDVALADVYDIWEPDSVWRAFFENELNDRSRGGLLKGTA